MSLRVVKDVAHTPAALCLLELGSYSGALKIPHIR